jgi:hypothetical protein
MLVDQTFRTLTVGSNSTSSAGSPGSGSPQPRIQLQPGNNSAPASSTAQPRKKGSETLLTTPIPPRPA